MIDIDEILNIRDDELKRKDKNQGIKELFKLSGKSDIKTKTDLNLNEIKKLTRLKLIANIYNIKMLDNLCDYYCLFKISKNRLGREEIVNLMIEKEKEKEEIKKKKSFFKRLLK